MASSSTRLKWLWPLLLATTILIASSFSRVAAPPIVDFDKLAHFSVFGLLASLVARIEYPGRRVWWALLIVSLFGLSDEIHQSFTPGRDVELLDWVADTLGALTAVTAYTYWAWYRRLLERPLWGQSRVENRG